MVVSCATAWPHAACTDGARRAQLRIRGVVHHSCAQPRERDIGRGACGRGVRVAESYLEIVGATPVPGRPLPASHAAATAANEVLISHGLWQRLFGGSHDAVGSAAPARADIRSRSSVCCRRGFRGPVRDAPICFIRYARAPEISFADYFSSGEYFHNVVARMRKDVSLHESRAEFAAIATRIATIVPARSDGATSRSGDVVPLNDARMNAQSVRARTYVAIGAVLVLLIAAVNIASLIVVRIGARHREFAVRRAVGASRFRVFRAVATEMTIVTLAGLAAALLLAKMAPRMPSFGRCRPAWRRRPTITASWPASPISMLDVPVFVVVASIPRWRSWCSSPASPAARCCGAIPPWHCSAVVSGSARSGSGTTRAPRRSDGAGDWICSHQQAFCSARWRRLRTFSPASSIPNVIAFSVAEDLAVQRPGAGPVLVDPLLTAMSRVRGLVGATVAQCTPYGARCARLEFVVEGRPQPEVPRATGRHRVGPTHFETLGIPILKGRRFTEADRRRVHRSSPSTRRRRDSSLPIGVRLAPESACRDGAGPLRTSPRLSASSAMSCSAPLLPERPGPDVYQPALQFSHPWTTVMLRTAAEPASALPAVRTAMRKLDPDLPVFHIVTLGALGEPAGGSLVPDGCWRCALGWGCSCSRRSAPMR